MTKVIFPENGLSLSHVKQLDQVKQLLVLASKGSFNVPYDFQYRGYLNNLSSEIKKYIDGLESIKEEFAKIDANYSSMSSDMAHEFDTLEKYTISKRDSII